MTDNSQNHSSGERSAALGADRRRALHKRRYSSESRFKYLGLSAILISVGFLVMLLMTIVGLSPALGAFIAGVVLANSEYRHELESDIDPFKGLLLGL